MPKFDNKIEVIKFFGLPLAIPVRAADEPLVGKTGFSRKQLDFINLEIRRRGIDSLLDQKRKIAQGKVDLLLISKSEGQV